MPYGMHEHDVPEVRSASYVLRLLQPQGPPNVQNVGNMPVRHAGHEQ
jgi:hypothetical protein